MFFHSARVAVGVGTNRTFFVLQDKLFSIRIFSQDFHVALSLRSRINYFLCAAGSDVLVC